MSKKDLKTLDTEQLERKRKQAHVILGITVAGLAVGILAVIVTLAMGKPLQITTNAWIPGAVFIALLIYRGKKEIEEELGHRKG